MQKSKDAKSNQRKERGICSAWYKTIWNTPEEGEAAWANRISYSGDWKRLPKLFRGVTSKPKRDNECYFKCTWRERSGQETRGLRVTRGGFHEQ